MKFQQVNEWSLESLCGHYTITRTGPYWQHEYMAYHGAFNKIGGPFTSSDDAKKCCVEHKARKV